MIKKGKLALFVMAILLITVSACTPRELCPAYSAAEEVIEEPAVPAS